MGFVSLSWLFVGAVAAHNLEEAIRYRHGHKPQGDGIGLLEVPSSDSPC